MEPVTAEDLRAALESLSELDPNTVLRTDDGDGMVVGSLFRSGTIDETVAGWDRYNPVHRAQAEQIVAWAENPDAYTVRPESKMPWGWILFGTAAALGGTWLAVRLIKNGS